LYALNLSGFSVRTKCTAKLFDTIKNFDKAFYHLTVDFAKQYHFFMLYCL